MPIGEEAGVTFSASACSISSNRSNGSRPSRSSLLTKVTIGTSRSRQTSKSLRVCSSMLPWRHWDGVEHHHRTVDRGQCAVGILAEILVARRVEQVESEPSCSKLITAEETEMPRARPTAIQSERTCRRSPRLIAPRPSGGGFADARARRSTVAPSGDRVLSKVRSSRTRSREGCIRSRALRSQR
jgi:hypothetical protein